MKEVAVIGYSGHSFVVIDIFLRSGQQVRAYCDNEEKDFNPFALPYWGRETDEAALQKLRTENVSCFIAIGNNAIRKKIYESLQQNQVTDFATAIHPLAIYSDKVRIGAGTMVAAGAMINPLAEIGNISICNTGTVIEHECKVGDFVHIAPGAVLAGGVVVKDHAFVGANATIKQNVTIGEGAIVGANAVVLHDVPAKATVTGNPGKVIER